MCNPCSVQKLYPMLCLDAGCVWISRRWRGCGGWECGGAESARGMGGGRVHPYVYLTTGWVRVQGERLEFVRVKRGALGVRGGVCREVWEWGLACCVVGHVSGLPLFNVASRLRMLRA